MNIKAFYNSTIGKKIIVALTGIFLIIFVVGHMAGNLKTFAGYDPSGLHKLDVYANFLRTFGQELFGYAGFLWGFRILLLVALVLHVVNVIQLQIRNNQARGKAYAVSKHSASSFSAQIMFWGGLFLLFFVVIHLLHLTFGTIHFQGFVAGEVYANVYYTFKVWYIVLFYLIALLALTFHLMHGIWSVFQTLGINSPNKNNAIKLTAKLVALLLFIGFASVPAAVYLGIIPEPNPSEMTSGH